ncbi:hypothetical protein [Microbacterium hominis]|uniref:Uncharacterized protein n=1 Tax=Microbacterium hominis TaxID=162426 RepID=A0A0B4E0M7_9MICO|nr:hypothetical protein [Microbacterium hominis]KIC60108.1 hypothetical protein RM52_01500 [Microbacterium hominis]
MHAENGLVDLEGMVHLPTVSPAALAATGLIMIIWPKLYLRTGIAMGPVVVELEPLRKAPARERAGAGGEWEDVVEFTAEHLPGAPVEVRGASQLPPPGASVPAPDVSPSGNLRVRLSAAGRAVAPDQVVSDACEQYLIQFWPADSADQQVTSSLTNVVRRSDSVEIIPPDSAWAADESRWLP